MIRLPEPFPDRSRIALFVVLATVVVVAGVAFRNYLSLEHLSLEHLARQEQHLRALREANPILVFGAAAGLYVAVAGMALPGAAALSVVFAWFFGFWPALILISFSSTLGATISFLISRFLLRDSIRNRFGERLSAFNENLKRDGAFYLFTLRLIPVVPFFLINLVMGLTPLKTWTFWWVSQLGMLPGTVVYVWAGSSVPSLSKLVDQGISGIFNWKIFAAFALLGIFPFIAKKISDMIRPGDSKPLDPTPASGD